jgi:hypothetical protein
VCGSNCLSACSGELVRDRTAVLGEDRQSPVIAAKTSAHGEFNAHVFQGGSTNENGPTATSDGALGLIGVLGRRADQGHLQNL